MAMRGLNFDANTASYNTDFWSPEQWQSFGSSGGYVDNGKLMLDGNQISVPETAEANSLFGAEGFGMNTGTLKGLGSIGNIAQGVGGLYLGSKQLGLAKDKFAFDKDMVNKQYAMAKDAYDKQVARANSIGSQMNAGKV